MSKQWPKVPRWWDQRRAERLACCPARRCQGDRNVRCVRDRVVHGAVPCLGHEVPRASPTGSADRWNSMSTAATWAGWCPCGSWWSPRDRPGRCDGVGGSGERRRRRRRPAGQAKKLRRGGPTSAPPTSTGWSTVMVWSRTWMSSGPPPPTSPASPGCPGRSGTPARYATLPGPRRGSSEPLLDDTPVRASGSAGPDTPHARHRTRQPTGPEGPRGDRANGTKGPWRSRGPSRSTWPVAWVSTFFGVAHAMRELVDSAPREHDSYFHDRGRESRSCSRPRCPFSTFFVVSRSGRPEPVRPGTGTPTSQGPGPVPRLPSSSADDWGRFMAIMPFSDVVIPAWRPCLSAT